jgi:RNA polymerase sigma factor (sigma-70 family)
MATASNNIIKVFENYGKQLFRFIRGRVRSNEDAEDILQEVWYQLSNLTDVDTIDSISGWLYRVAKNRIVDSSRKKKTDLIDDHGYIDDEGEWRLPDILLSESKTPEDEYLRNLFWEELMAALAELPEKQREVFVLNEMEDITLQEIADRTGENLKTIISRKRYAVLHLRERLSALYKETLGSS